MCEGAGSPWLLDGRDALEVSDAPTEEEEALERDDEELGGVEDDAIGAVGGGPT